MLKKYSLKILTCVSCMCLLTACQPPQKKPTTSQSLDVLNRSATAAAQLELNKKQQKMKMKVLFEKRPVEKKFKSLKKQILLFVFQSESDAEICCLNGLGSNCGTKS